MRRLIVVLVVLIMGLAAAVLPAAPVAAAGVPLITAEELKAKLGSPDLTILDVRRAAHWNASDRKIAGAVREDPEAIESWAGKYAKEKTLVLYCAWPYEYTSARVARELIKMGFQQVYVLKGGWNKWVDEQYPTEPK